jgi:radical SAM superfamily enzyme YgiQ (UPF0313 family)
MADIVLINPRFDVSFWGLEHALPLFGKRANMPIAALPLLAALTPPGHTVTLLDENVEPIDFDRVARADIVGVTGMTVQRFRMREILTELKARGAFTVVGGPWVSVQEDYFGPLADAIFVGEAEETWPRFLGEWERGSHARRYEQAERTDMTRVPPPRFDLLKVGHYLFGSLQFSRGCPFQCEFCDIIVTFGRRPRVKTAEQVLAELEAMRALGLQIVFVVDDNLIGNKRAVKELLRAVSAWQEANGYPLALVTEASLDLADDDEMLRLMVAANFLIVFVGIESPNEASLRETKKFQNVRAGRTMLERVHAIQRAGLEVWCGMILGFDHDGPDIFGAQRAFLRAARISVAMVGILHAVPKTPLHARLAAEGRLDPADVPEHGTNVVPLRLTRQELRDGYVRLLDELYEPGAYFDRVDDLYLRQWYVPGLTRERYWRRHPWQWFKAKARFLLRSAGLFARLMRRVPDPALRREYRRRIWGLWRARRDPGLLEIYVIKCAIHFHHHTMARQMAEGRGPFRSSF